MPYEDTVLNRMLIASGELPATTELKNYRPPTAYDRLVLANKAKEMGPYQPPAIPSELFIPRVGESNQYTAYPKFAPPAAQPMASGVIDADTMFPNSAPQKDFGTNMGVPDYRGAPAPSAVAAGPKSQIDAINAQTMQNATGKAQEVETMSDLQKMAQAYFGGRTREQKQKEAFMNIAAGLAAGKSPRFMDNLGGAVSGAINFNRDDTNRREKEALEGFIKIQGLDDARSNNAAENEIRREANDISRINATRERVSAQFGMKALQKQASDLSKNITKLQAEGGDPATIGMMQLQLGEVMTQINRNGGIGFGEEPPAASSSGMKRITTDPKTGKVVVLP